MSIVSQSALTQLESNLVRQIDRANTPNATSLLPGKIQIAKSDEVKRGVENSKAITPLSLHESLQDNESKLSKAVIALVADKLEERNRKQEAQIQQIQKTLFSLEKSVSSMQDKLSSRQKSKVDLSAVYKAIGEIEKQKHTLKQTIDENILALIVEKMLVKMLSENKANVLDEIVAGILTNKTHLSNMKGAIEK